MLTQSNETFFTCIGCMDGRVQDVAALFGRKEFGAIYADAITEAGMVGILAKDDIEPAFAASLKYKIVDVSIGVHKSSGIVIHGHTKCAGNPVEDSQQKSDIKKSVHYIQSFVHIPIIGLFIYRGKDGKWIEERIV